MYILVHPIYMTARACLVCGVRECWGRVGGGGLLGDRRDHRGRSGQIFHGNAVRNLCAGRAQY